MFKNGYPSSGGLKTSLTCLTPVMSQSALNALSKAYRIRLENQSLREATVNDHSPNQFAFRNL
jgi:hypothetical protein